MYEVKSVQTLIFETLILCGFSTLMSYQYSFCTIRGCIRQKEDGEEKS